MFFFKLYSDLRFQKRSVSSLLLLLLLLLFVFISSCKASFHWQFLLFPYGVMYLCVSVCVVVVGKGAQGRI